MANSPTGDRDRVRGAAWEGALSRATILHGGLVALGATVGSSTSKKTPDATTRATRTWRLFQRWNFAPKVANADYIALAGPHSPTKGEFT